MSEEAYGWSPTGAPLDVQREDHWRHFDNSVDAVSFGFVATAILVSMFLLMAIFERFLRPAPTAFSHAGGRSQLDPEAQMGFAGKLAHPSPKVSFRPIFGYFFCIFGLCCDHLLVWFSYLNCWNLGLNDDMNWVKTLEIFVCVCFVFFLSIYVLWSHVSGILFIICHSLELGKFFVYVRSCT